MDSFKLGNRKAFFLDWGRGASSSPYVPFPNPKKKKKEENLVPFFYKWGEQKRKLLEFFSFPKCRKLRRKKKVRTEKTYQNEWNGRQKIREKKYDIRELMCFGKKLEGVYL